MRQLTFGGTNAEAYFSADDKYLTFQHQGQFYDPQTQRERRPDDSLRPDLHDARAIHLPGRTGRLR